MSHIKLLKYSKKVIGILKIPDEFQDAVMVSAGYDRHPKGNGWIKDISFHRRFHITLKEELLELHVDETVGGFHRLTRGKEHKMELWYERRRIKVHWDTINPVLKIMQQERIDFKKAKRRIKYAENIRALTVGQELVIIKKSDD